MTTKDFLISVVEALEHKINMLDTFLDRPDPNAETDPDEYQRLHELRSKNVIELRFAQRLIEAAGVPKEDEGRLAVNEDGVVIPKKEAT